MGWMTGPFAPPLTRFLSPLTHLLATHCTLRPRAPPRSFYCSLGHSFTPELMGKRVMSMGWTPRFHTIQIRCAFACLLTPSLWTTTHSLALRSLFRSQAPINFLLSFLSCRLPHSGLVPPIIGTLVLGPSLICLFVHSHRPLDRLLRTTLCSLDRLLCTSLCPLVCSCTRSLTHPRAHGKVWYFVSHFHAVPNQSAPALWRRHVKVEFGFRNSVFDHNGNPEVLLSHRTSHTLSRTSLYKAEETTHQWQDRFCWSNFKGSSTFRWHEVWMTRCHLLK